MQFHGTPYEGLSQQSDCSMYIQKPAERGEDGTCLTKGGARTPRWFTLHHTDGHGAFKKGVHRLGLAEDPRCGCPLGWPDTPEHILYECTKYNSIRERLRGRATIEGIAWPPQLDFWARRRCYKDFATYVDRAMRLRLEEEPLQMK